MSCPPGPVATSTCTLPTHLGDRHLVHPARCPDPLPQHRHLTLGNAVVRADPPAQPPLVALLQRAQHAGHRMLRLTGAYVTGAGGAPEERRTRGGDQHQHDGAGDRPQRAGRADTPERSRHAATLAQQRAHRI